MAAHAVQFDRRRPASCWTPSQPARDPSRARRRDRGLSASG
ncbi:hypothetical protein DVS28_a2096 [Euzebya pacifica]|uniref:Uncharacterized protein n=1 Tax=Euzebya pacifica TaxID=1608957 RepID=A0A346XX33_9ACTN|nr:hypothetical protein DVS28_a2096 [Euzebya pacifica]